MHQPDPFGTPVPLHKDVHLSLVLALIRDIPGVVPDTHRVGESLLRCDSPPLSRKVCSLTRQPLSYVQSCNHTRRLVPYLTVLMHISGTYPRDSVEFGLSGTSSYVGTPHRSYFKSDSHIPKTSAHGGTQEYFKERLFVNIKH